MKKEEGSDVTAPMTANPDAVAPTIHPVLSRKIHQVWDGSRATRGLSLMKEAQEISTQLGKWRKHPLVEWGSDLAMASALPLAAFKAYEHKMRDFIAHDPDGEEDRRLLRELERTNPAEAEAFLRDLTLHAWLLPALTGAGVSVAGGAALLAALRKRRAYAKKLRKQADEFNSRYDEEVEGPLDPSVFEANVSDTARLQRNTPAPLQSGTGAMVPSDPALYKGRRQLLKGSYSHAGDSRDPEVNASVAPADSAETPDPGSPAGGAPLPPPQSQATLATVLSFADDIPTALMRLFSHS